MKGGGLALHGEIGVNDRLKLRSITSYRKDENSHADRFRRASCSRCRRSGNLQEQAVQPGGAGGHRARTARGRHRRLLSGRERLQRIRRPSIQTVPGLGFTAATRGDVDTKTWAVFGDFSYDVTDQISLSAGIRYTRDKRHADVFRQSLSSAARPNSADPRRSTRPAYHLERSPRRSRRTSRMPQGHGWTPDSRSATSRMRSQHIRELLPRLQRRRLRSSRPVSRPLTLMATSCLTG